LHFGVDAAKTAGDGVMSENRVSRADPAGIAVAALLLAVASVIFWDMSTLQLTSVYGVGPKAMPAVVATGLVILSIGNLVMAFTEGLPPRESADPKVILLIIGGLAALIAIIGLGGGFILATTILFATTAAAFGRRAFLTDLAIGFVLSVVIFILFSKLLTLSLPSGPLERLL
jgi:putative tricarboxylic transport membrane protein